MNNRNEPIKTLNGVRLSIGQAITLRVPIESMVLELCNDPVALGRDEVGVGIRANYLARLTELRAIIYS